MLPDLPWWRRSAQRPVPKKAAQGRREVSDEIVTTQCRGASFAPQIIAAMSNPFVVLKLHIPEEVFS
jgi:hypothetical protein